MKRFGILVPLAGMLVVLLASCWFRAELSTSSEATSSAATPSRAADRFCDRDPAIRGHAPGQSMKFTALSSLDGTLEWMVNSIPGGNSSVGLIDAKGNYTAPLTSSLRMP